MFVFPIVIKTFLLLIFLLMQYSRDQNSVENEATKPCVCAPNDKVARYWNHTNTFSTHTSHDERSLWRVVTSH